MGNWLDKTGLTRFSNKLKSNIKITESRYSYTTTANQEVSFTIPNFNAQKMVLDVYINGIHATPTTHYMLSGNVITIVNNLEIGQILEFVVREVSI